MQEFPALLLSNKFFDNRILKILRILEFMLSVVMCAFESNWLIDDQPIKLDLYIVKSMCRTWKRPLNRSSSTISSVGGLQNPLETSQLE